MWFWTILGVLSVLLVALAYMAAGAALATAWGVTYALTEKRWGTVGAGAAGMGAVWAVTVGAMFTITGDAGWTAGYAAILGVFMAVFTPKH